MPVPLAFMLGELEISNVTAVVLVVVALVFVGSFAVVSLQTGELIKPPKKDCRLLINGLWPSPAVHPEALGSESTAG